MQVVITPAGKEFITPVTLSSLSGKPVVSEFFTANTGEWHSHVDLGLWADLMVIAPATASTLAKMASGVADNMLVTTYLSAKEPVMVAPAMDLDMYRHPTTQRNLQTLRRDGVKVLESPEGELASGLSGKGRMLEPEQILEEIVSFLVKRNMDFTGKKVLITAGPTYEKIDPVRFIGNYSSGKMGIALAEEFSSRGAAVKLICGPVKDVVIPVKERIEVERVESALDMLEACKASYHNCDIAIFAAAVADYRPESVPDKKIKREKNGALDLKLVPNPDIALELGKTKKNNQINVGFALETDNGVKNAIEKMERKNLDLIILNPAGEKNAGFNSETNRVSIISSKNCGLTKFPLMTKRECAEIIADSIKQYSDNN